MKLARTFTSLYNRKSEHIGWFYKSKYHFITQSWNYGVGVSSHEFSLGVQKYEMIGTKERMTEELLQELINADLSNNNVSR